MGLPLILFFLYEAAGGVTYTPEVLRELFALPGVVGIKMATLDSVMTYQDVAALIQTEFPETVLITGEDRFLGYSLLLGAKAALIGMGAAVPAPQAALVRAAVEEDAARFVELTRAVDAFAQITFRAPMEGYIRHALGARRHRRHSRGRRGRSGWPSSTAAEREEVRRATLELDAVHERSAC